MTETNGYTSVSALTTPRGRRYLDVQHPDYGKFCIQNMDASQRGMIEDRVAKGKGVDLKARIIIEMLVDPENKKPVLLPENIQQLQSQDAAMIDWLATACIGHAGFTDNDIAALVKN